MPILTAIKSWKDSYVHEVLSALGFTTKPISDNITLLYSLGSIDVPATVCYIILPDESRIAPRLVAIGPKR